MKNFVAEKIVDSLGFAVIVAAITFGCVSLGIFELMYSRFEALRGQKSEGRVLARIIVFGVILGTMDDIITLINKNIVLLCNLGGFLKVLGFGLVNS